MDRRRSRRASARYAAALVLAAGTAHAEVVVAPGPTGGIGAFWLARTRVMRADKVAHLKADFPLPEGVDDRGAGLPALAGALVHASSSGAVDLVAALKAEHAEAEALAFGVLRVSAPFTGLLSLGVDDGVVALLDGKPIVTSDDGRPGGDDEHLVRVTLEKGDHPLLLKLHQRRAGWTLRLRVLGPDLARADGVSWVLPGEVDAAKVADGLVEVGLDRFVDGAGMAPRVELRFRGGRPIGGDPLAPKVTAERDGAEFFAFDVGEPPSVWDFSARLPALPPGGKARVTVTVRGQAKTFDASPEQGLVDALGRAERALAAARKSPLFLKDAEGVVATLEHLSARVLSYARKGDGDVRAQLDEAAWLREVADAVLAERDPWTLLRGARRIAYRSPLDGRPSSFGLYVPKTLDEKKTYPLVVALHGLNGKPMNMMRWFFGRDDDAHDGEWEDRHPGEFPDVDAIVVTPMAHFNAMYRYAGEVDVMNVVRWATARLPVDKDRISVTGPSMGGTGTAQVAFHNPDTFAAAAPLCGYHSWTLRGDWAGKKTEWEVFGGEERSTVEWASNGLYLPLWIVHGTKDLPVENSGVLIDKYKALGYSLLEEHPEEGHNVWQKTYEGMKGLGWLRAYRRPAHPSRLVLRTNNLRVDHTHWLTVTELERSMRWGEVVATAKKAAGKKPATLSVSAKGVTGLALGRDDKLIGGGAVDVELGKASLSFGEGEEITVHREADGWKKGPPRHEGLHKNKGLSGPIRDVFHDPLVVVWGATDPTMARANEALAKHFAAVRPGFEIAYPQLADVDATKDALEGRAWVLVGTPKSNAVLARIADRLPVRFTDGGVRVGDRSFEGPGVGAAFVFPNPEQPGRYVVVLGSPTIEGTMRGLSLPDLLPDWVVWDHDLARARGAMILGQAKVRDGGFFSEAWAL